MLAEGEHERRRGVFLPRRATSAILAPLRKIALFSDRDWTVNAAAILAVAGVALVPFIVAADQIDRFRTIKESAMRTEALIGLLLLTIAATFGDRERLRALARRRDVLGILGAGIVWIAFTTIISTNRLLSAPVLVTWVAAALVFITVWYGAPRIGLAIIDVLVPAAVLNTVLAVLQETGRWNPFTVSPRMPLHMRATACLGNPNIVGTFLALHVVVLLVAAIEVHGVRRWMYAAGAVVGAAGVLFSQTRTAVIGLAAGVVLISIGRSWKRALLLVAGLVLALGLALALHMRVVTSLLAIPRAIAQGQLNVVASERVSAALAAIEMTRDRPITGIGPGTYKYHYMPYIVRVEERYPASLVEQSGTNFGETHNDHLQTLAEIGAVGYLLFLGIVALVVLSARRVAVVDDLRRRLATRVAFPLAGTLLVLCLAQFPLQVAVTRELIVSFGALLVGWSES
jgi:O-antigen ligase